MRKKILKKLWAMVLAASMALTVVSCKPDPETPNTDNSSKGFEDTSTVFVESEKTDYNIIVAEDATEAEIYAASELKKYVKVKK